MTGPRREPARPVISRALPKAQTAAGPASSQTATSEALLPKSFIGLQIEFAWTIAAAKGIPFHTALLNFTTIHRRLFQHPDKGIDARWWVFVQNLPEDPIAATDFIYDAYVQREARPRLLPGKDISMHGCFSFEYRAHKNQFVLHFAARDPRGNLSRNRMDARRQDLISLTRAIAGYRKTGATIRMSSWLLDIEAFNRLMPAAFRANAKAVAAEKTQDMGLWGQFVCPRDGIKPAMAAQLLDGARDSSQPAANSFPCKEWTTSIPQDVFFDTYLSSQGTVSHLNAA